MYIAYIPKNPIIEWWRVTPVISVYWVSNAGYMFLGYIKY